VFTARYALSPYIKQIRSIFKGLIFCLNNWQTMEQLCYLFFKTQNCRISISKRGISCEAWRMLNLFRNEAYSVRLVASRATSERRHFAGGKQKMGTRYCVFCLRRFSSSVLVPLLLCPSGSLSTLNGSPLTSSWGMVCWQHVYCPSTY
jgi:hypothetical protein